MFKIVDKYKNGWRRKTAQLFAIWTLLLFTIIIGGSITNTITFDTANILVLVWFFGNIAIPPIDVYLLS